MKRTILTLAALLLASPTFVRAAEPLPLMLRLPQTGEDPTKIDFTKLPTLKGTHALVTQGDYEWHFRLHNYLAFSDGRFWCMWSHGPRVEDRPKQHVRYATSADGFTWSEPKEIVGPSPREGFRYTARGLWVREGRLIALVNHDEALNDHLPARHSRQDQERSDVFLGFRFSGGFARRHLRRRVLPNR
jgi:hypothetical protein